MRKSAEAPSVLHIPVADPGEHRPESELSFPAAINAKAVDNHGTGARNSSSAGWIQDLGVTPAALRRHAL